MRAEDPRDADEAVRRRDNYDFGGYRWVVMWLYEVSQMLRFTPGSTLLVLAHVSMSPWTQVSLLKHVSIL